MVKFIIQYLDEETGEWKDSRTAFTTEELDRKLHELKELGFETRTLENKNEQREPNQEKNAVSNRQDQQME